MHAKNDICIQYNGISRTDGALLTPKNVRLLRGLIGMSPQRFADMASVKKNQLLKFERGQRDLSPRDRRWMIAAFATFDIDVFEAQGHVQITMAGEPIVENGVVVDGVHKAVDRSWVCHKRHQARLSQRQLSRLSGLSQGKISMIERGDSTRFFPLSDVARLNCVLSA